MLYVGIDPGSKGAFCFLDGCEASFYKMPKDYSPEKLVEVFRRIKSYGPHRVIMEKQITKPMVGTKPCPRCKTPIPYRYSQKGVHTSFTNYGILIGIMYAIGISFEEVDGTVWKKHFKLEKKGKEGSIKLAKQFFPDSSSDIGADDNKAEALLLAEYGRRHL